MIIARTKALVLVAGRATTLVLIAAVVAAACSKPMQLAPGGGVQFIDRTPSLESAPAELADLLVCTDSLGRPMSADAGSICLPCVPLTVQGNATEARRHIGRLWRQNAKAPYGATDVGGQCTRLSYLFALLADSTDRSLRVDYALFRLASAQDSVRAAGLATLDFTLDTLLTAHDSAGASELLEYVGRVMWERAQRMYVRPEYLDLDDREKAVHELARGAPALRRLPPVPSPSKRLGASEAHWASLLFHAAAALRHDTPSIARLTRLALAPHVLLGEWSELDRLSSAMLARSPRDSVAAVARALARYKQEYRSLARHVHIDTTFDNALRLLPPSDSAAYDNFDAVFTAEDDEWRYGFLPGVRTQLDRRAWAIVDPLWLTPVNELRLARRARKAEADFRYADIAVPNQSGSETDPGVLLVKGGPPRDRWSLQLSGAQQGFAYGWGQYFQSVLIWKDPNSWRVFYGDLMAFDQIARGELDPAQECAAKGRMLVACAREQSASWNEAVFYGRQDTIDVTLARFRASRDSFDMYFGARIPLRGFRHRGMMRALNDSLSYGLFVSTSYGNTIHRRIATQPLPRESEIAWFDQWTVRVGDGNIMHRVEAVDPRHARGARGGALFTSAEGTVQRLDGFGLSDILAAERIAPRSNLLRSWRDLDVTPNGGVVAPHVPIALAWEVYDLARGPDGLARWRVTLRREDGTMRSRFDAQSLIIGTPGAGTQVIASEPDAAGIVYTRTEPARAKVVEFLKFNLSDAPPGRHVLILTVEDLVAKTSASRSVSLRILRPLLQTRDRRGGVAPPEFSGFRLLDMDREGRPAPRRPR